MRKRKILVVGGGAAGMMAALSAAEEGCLVTIWERNDRLGKKLLSTGNGKCNFSNRDMGIEHYYGSDLAAASGVLRRFGMEETVELFGAMGMLSRDKNGCLYPYSEQASTVSDILLLRLRRLGVRVETGVKAEKIFLLKDGRLAAQSGERQESFDGIILACGGCAAPKTGSDGSGFALAESLGHTIIPPVPALVQLRCRENLKEVAGVRARADLQLYIDGRLTASEYGELQLTDYGISGIAVFQISRLAACALQRHQEAAVSVDFMKDYPVGNWREYARRRIAMSHGETVEELFTGMLNRKLMRYFIKQAGLKPERNVAAAEYEKLCKVFCLCREWTLHITSANSFDNAQVCAGGIPFAQLTEDLESRMAPGVYFAGELLDIDGKCGGYNLQWAWSSGYVAGKSAAKGGHV